MIKKAVRYTLSFVLYYGGIIALLRWIQKSKGEFKILVYHRVNNNLEGSSPVLPVSKFRKHMVYLKKYYKVVNLAETVLCIKDNNDFPPRGVSVTFDDGYKDIIGNVFPIIQELDIPITIFLTSGCLGDSNLLWTDELYFFFKEQNRLKEFRQFREKLKNINNNDRVMIMEGLKPKYIKNLMLNWEEVKKLNKDNRIEIGAHTKTHLILTQANSDTVSEEISGSKKEIEQVIQQPIAGFSYSAGKFNPAIKKLVKESSFVYACCVDGKFNGKDSDLYALSRVNIDNSPVFVFAAELCGVLNWLRRIFS